MFTKILFLLAILISSATSEAVECPAVLIGHAILPATTTVEPPSDAPSSMGIVGRFTGPGNRRVEELYKITQRSGENLPRPGQPTQGFSGIKTVKDHNGMATGEFWVLMDNGFGTKQNSADVMLMALKVRPDFMMNEVVVDDVVFLHDPNRVIPFPIQNEHTEMRYLTGADFDPESIQPVSEFLYIGDEFGPFILITSMTGVIVAIMDAPSHFDDEEVIIAPDSPFVRLPSRQTEEMPMFEVKRSGGFEGMAQSMDGSTLIPLLQQPIWNVTMQEYEVDSEGNPFLRFFEIDVETGFFSSTDFKYRLEGSHAIGDFNMISNCCGLIIECDGSSGDPNLLCQEGQTEDCFEEVAQFKRIYYIDFDNANEEGFVEKKAYIDLLNVIDDDEVAVIGTTNGTFVFPFANIEDVDIVDNDTIIVANDNNFPFSISRSVGVADNNEFIHLYVSALLSGGEEC